MPTFVAAATGQTGTSSQTSVSATIPSAAAAGQILIAHIATERDAVAVGLALSGSGWTVLGSGANSTQQSYLTAWRALTVGDPGGTVTATVTTGRRMAMVLAVYSAVSSVQFVAGTSATTGSGSATSTGPSITPTAANAMLVAVMASVRNGTPFTKQFTESAGWTERGDVTSVSTTAGNPQAALADKLISGGSGVAQTGPTWTGVEADGTTPVVNQFHWPSALALLPATGSNSIPVAAFVFTTSNLTATFDGRSSSDTDGTITAYSWDYGDGGTGTGAQPSHTYTAAGTYTAVLTVTDSGGATGTVNHDVTVTATTAVKQAGVFVATDTGWQPGEITVAYTSGGFT